MKPSKAPDKGGGEPAGAVKGKTLILGLIGALVLVVGLLFWAGMSGGSTHVPLPISRPRSSNHSMNSVTEAITHVLMNRTDILA